MPRFYCQQSLAIGNSIALDEAIARHIHVLRLQEGTSIMLFNGTGGEYRARLSQVGKKSVNVEIVEFVAREVELPFSLTLAQALPEASKMDWIIEKAVELGVTTIQALAAQRSVVRLSEERALKKVQHWQAIAIAACEQCGRNRVPEVVRPLEFSQWITQTDIGCRLLLTPRADQSLAQWAQQSVPQNVVIIVGPEGGLSPQEEAAARAQDAIAVSMGPRILRTETAGLAAIAVLNAHWGAMEAGGFHREIQEKHL